jgi:hypothetical protein
LGCFVVCLGLFFCRFGALAQTTSDYDTLVQKGKTQLQAGSADLALASGEAAIKMNADRWEGYALAGGALMNLKRYEDAADKFSEAIKRAPEAKQPALRDLRRQCLLAESGVSPAAKQSAPATTTQAEIVLWKSIENSTNPDDFRAYLAKYPGGAFAPLAQTRLDNMSKAALEREQEQRQYGLQHGSDLVDTIWIGQLQFKHFQAADLLIRFSGNGKATYLSYYTKGKRGKKAAEVEADAHVLSKNEFVGKYFLNSGSSITWAMDDSTLRMTTSETKDSCPQSFLGSRSGDVMKGTTEFLATGGFFGCAHTPGEFQLQLLHR